MGMTKIALGERRVDVPSSKKPLCFNVDHRPDVTLLSSKTFAAYRESAIQPLPSPLEFTRDLKRFMVLSVTNALEALSSIDRKTMQPHFRQYLRWMESEKENLDGNTTSNFPEWKNYRKDHDYLEKLSTRVANANRTGKFYAEIGPKIPQILKGEVDALNLFFATGLVKGFYQDNYSTTNGIVAFLVYLDALAHKQPQLKILDIGAGTGSVASKIVKTLTTNGEQRSKTPRFTHYDYTDISPSFFDSAREIFQGYEDRVAFRTLDIEKDPIKQGFEANSYDLIIADNVLHATENLTVSLSNARKLLKPGGKIALMELTRPEEMKTNFAFGLLPGWWRATDECRNLSAGITEDVWNDVLVKTGFSGLDLSLPDFYDEECHEHSVLVSTALPLTEAPAPEVSTLFIVTAPGSALQDHIATSLRASFLAMDFENVRITSLEEMTTIKDSKLACIALFELGNSVLDNISPQDFMTVRDFGRLLEVVPTQSFPYIHLSMGSLVGVRQENVKMKFVTIAFEPGQPAADHFARNILQVYRETTLATLDGYEPEYVERSGRLCIDILVQADYLNDNINAKASEEERAVKPFGAGPSLALTVASPGLLDTLEFVNNKSRLLPLSANEVEIEAHASGVNFRDCLIALGRLPGIKMGFECSGYVKSVGEACKDAKVGDRVCGIGIGTYQTFARCKELDTIHLPEQMSFLEGAAILVAFLTAYYALIMVARIREGESILIHSAAGGTGQAAIQIAQLYNAEIYVSVVSTEKKELLMSQYNIPEDHIFYSRNTTFGQGIKRMTKERRGVDIVLNSLSGDSLMHTWECMASFGRFLEIGKRDILANASLPMFPFAKNVSFHAIDLNEDRDRRPEVMLELRNGVASLLSERKTHPSQPLHIYGVAEIESAFRYLQSGRNTGKTVVELRPDDLVRTHLDAQPAWLFDDRATYVIAGGLGGIGRSVARWMVRKKAKHLILLSRFGPRNDTARKFLGELIEQDIQVEVPACDISNLEAVRATLDSLAQHMPPVKGCIQSSMLLRDSIFDDMSHEQWIEAAKPKVQGTQNLHTLLPAGMDFFIMISSIAGLIGSQVQANYSSGCSYQDSLAHQRVGVGEKATTFNLGIMVDDGVLAENDKMMAVLQSTGYLLNITQDELYALLEHHCNPSLPLSTPLKTQILIGVDNPASLASKDVHPPMFMRRPPLRHLYNIALSSSDMATPTGQSLEPRVGQILSDVTSLEEAANIVASELMKKLSKALAVPLENLDKTKAMHVYGVDSLVAVELRNWFLQAIDADVAIFEILGNSSFEDVGMLVASKSRLVLGVLGADEVVNGNAVG